MTFIDFLKKITGITAYQNSKARRAEAEERLREIADERDYPFGRPPAASAPLERVHPVIRQKLAAAPRPAARPSPAPQPLQVVSPPPAPDFTTLPLSLHILNTQAHFGAVAAPDQAPPQIVSGKGGDFAGAGASGDWEQPRAAETPAVFAAPPPAPAPAPAPVVESYSPPADPPAPAPSPTCD